MEYVLHLPRINISFILVGLLFIYLLLIGLNIYKTNYLDEITTLLLLLMITMIQLISYPWASNYIPKGHDLYLKTISKTIITFWLYWFAGFNIRHIFEKHVLQKLFFILWVLFTVGTVVFTLSSDIPFLITLNRQVIYLMLADSYAILSLIILSNYKKHWTKYLLILVSLLSLYALYSRASFYLYLCVILLLLFRENKYILFILIGVSIILLLQNYEVLRDSRMFRIILGTTDASSTMRSDFLRLGIQEIKKVGLLGQFLGEVEISGRGTYIHNFLSYLRQFGVIAFILLLCHVLYYYYRIVIDWWIAPRSNQGTFLFLFTTFILLELLFARAYTHTYLWLSISGIPVFLKEEQQQI